MSLQLTFADSEFNNKRRKILSRMNELMPWDQLETVIEPFNPKPGNGTLSAINNVPHSLHAT
jgi:IS5 family transposase